MGQVVKSPTTQSPVTKVLDYFEPWNGESKFEVEESGGVK